MSHKTQESNTSCVKVRGFLVNLFCDLRVTGENTYFSSLCSYLQQLCALKTVKKSCSQVEKQPSQRAKCIKLHKPALFPI